MAITDAFHIYDTTLRDGAQQEGLNLSVHDKITIARHLDDLGVGFIEGGWPGANPRDTEFFQRAVKEIAFKNATLVAFGATRRAGVKASDDPLLRALQDSGAPVVTLVAKAHDRHVDLALKTSLDENLAMIKDSIAFLKAGGQRVFLDAEHFFDGYRDNRAYALEVVKAAAEAGADVIAPMTSSRIPTHVLESIAITTLAAPLQTHSQQSLLERPMCKELSMDMASEPATQTSSLSSLISN
jgi:2-isopropylmalate synthase